MSESAKQKLPRDEAAELGLVNVQIDGEWHRFPKGTRMIEAVKATGKEVPHYCYHPRLTSPGTCRMCLVEMGMPPRPRPGEEPQYGEDGYQPIQWIPRPAISCANTVAENMGIRTNSLLTKEVRNGVMEFLLANHPLDCPICDQAGECRLQEFAVEHGSGTSHFEEQKVKKPKNQPIGPRIRLDTERCIMCSRCIRFMREVAEDPVLGFTVRGGYTTLAVHPDRPLDHNYGLNTVDICPVGALTANDFRFQMRVWFLKETPSIDVNCGTGCNITLWSRNDEIYRITPRDNPDVNSAWMPDSHRLNFHYLRSDARLLEPVARDADGKQAPLPWSEALARVVDGMKTAAGKGEAAIVASARMTNEEMFLTRRLAAALGIDTVAAVARPQKGDAYLIATDANPNSEGYKQIFGTTPGTKLSALRDGVRAGRIKALFVLHENLLKEAGFTAEDLKSLDFLACQHILSNPTADEADVVLPGAGFPEKRGSMINVTGRLQVLNRAIHTPGETHEDTEILLDLIRTAGGEIPGTSVAEVFRALADEVEIFHGHRLSTIPGTGIPLYETGVTIPLVEREKERIKKGEIVG